MKLAVRRSSWPRWVYPEQTDLSDKTAREKGRRLSHREFFVTGRSERMTNAVMVLETCPQRIVSKVNVGASMSVNSSPS